MTEDYDVVVVGARCAGAATALLLARRGVRVLVVDRARRGSDTVSTHALMRPAVVQLDRWGLLDDVVSAGTPPVRHTVFHYGADRVDVSLRPVAGTEALYAPRRTLLDPLLLDAAERAGADVLTGVRVTALLRDDAGTVRGVELDGGRRRVRAGLVVGADGMRSTVADAVEARAEHRGAHAGACAYGYAEDLPADGYEWFYGRGVTAGLIPTNAATLYFVASPAALGPVEGTRDAVVAALRSQWPSGAERMAAATPVSTVRRVPAVTGWLRRSWGAGWALVGDAGLFVDPMSSHGISQALRDAELLADAVTAPGPRPVALRRYQQQRDATARPLLDVVDRIASFGWELDEVRELLLAMSSLISDEVDALVDRPSLLSA